jgi:hypothetical protein
VGVREDRDDAIYLEYMPVPNDLPSDEEIPEEEESDNEEDIPLVSSPVTGVHIDTQMAETEEEIEPIPPKRKDDERIPSPCPHTPPLPLSPISNPSTPPRKRPRTSGWNAPDHIPDFLPPFPSHSPRHTPSPPPIALPPTASSLPSLPPKLDRPITPPPELTSNTGDYRTPIPHNISVLSSAPLTHLPTRPLTPPLPPPPQHGVPDLQRSLYQAYHYALTHPPPQELGPANPTRYKVAVTLIEQAQQKNPRWEPVPSLYGISVSNAPRVNSNGPTYPIPLGQDEKLNNGKGKEVEETRFPALPARPVIASERVAPLISQQGSRLPSLAREILTVSVALSSTSSRLADVAQADHTPSNYQTLAAAAAGAGRAEAHVRPGHQRAVELWSCSPNYLPSKRRQEGEGERGRCACEGHTRREAVRDVELGTEELPGAHTPGTDGKCVAPGDDRKWTEEERESCVVLSVACGRGADVAHEDFCCKYVCAVLSDCSGMPNVARCTILNVLMRYSVYRISLETYLKGRAQY